VFFGTSQHQWLKRLEFFRSPVKFESPITVKSWAAILVFA
jgi:hypothetical protein